MTGAGDETSGPAAAAGPGTAGDDLDLAFTRALRRVATAGSGAATRPGELRHRLVALLGPERAAALRPRVHRTVAAAEEHLPATLVSLAPITEPALRRLVADLAERRGWTVEAAARTVLDWRDALGLAPDPSATGWSVPPVVPEPTDVAVAPATPVWPPARPRTAALARLTGLPVRAAAHAYGGLSLRLFWVLVGALVIVALVAVLALPSALPGHPNALVSALSVLAAVGLSTRLQRGLLVVVDDGLTFVGFDRRMTAPTGRPVSVSWDEVRVLEPGTGGRATVGQVLLGSKRVHVGPEGSALLRALAGGRR
jgi:hypothetical protein